MVNVPIFDTVTGLFTGKTKQLSSPSAANTRTPGTTYASEYPYNYTQVTRAGHEIQLDDTSGNERVRIAHKSGSYTEISEDGRKVEVVTANESKTVKQSTTITIEKNGDIKIGGGARVVIGGDAHVEVKGNMTQVVGGSYNMTVNKDYNILVKGQITQNSLKDSYYKAEEDMYSLGANWTGGTTKGETKIRSRKLLYMDSLEGPIQGIAAANVYVYAGQNARLVANEGQAGLIGILGSATISGNTYVAIHAAGAEAQDPTGANPPKGGELRISANAANFTTKSVNSWDVNGAGFIWKYDGSYSIVNYSQGVPSTSQPPSPTDLRNK